MDRQDKTWTRGNGRSGFVLQVLLAALLVAVDQLTKAAVVSGLSDGRSVALIPNVLELTLVYNTGAAFGLGRGAKWLFVGAAILIIAGLLVWLWMHADPGKKTGDANDIQETGDAGNSGRRGSAFLKTAMVLLIAGAAGNLIDRLRIGVVIDFIYLKIINFPVFNVADICVTVGCAMLLLWLVINTGPDKV